jgi:ABC-type sugar transport system ATPase subunit
MTLQAAKASPRQTQQHAATAQPLLEATDIRRTFGETIALDSCFFSVRPGEIHVIVGENGSGKSTLIKVLSGIVSAESGALKWNGAPFQLRSPRAAQEAGIATLFQETLVLPEMSVRDNIMLGLDGVVVRKASLRESTISRVSRSPLSAFAVSTSRNSPAPCRWPIVSSRASLALSCVPGGSSSLMNRRPQSTLKIATACSTR